MRARIWVFAWCAVACSKGATTPAGPIGGGDVPLPAGMTVPAALDGHDSTITTCMGGKGDTPAKLHAHWKTFTANGTLYVASYSFDLLTAVPGLAVKLDGPAKVSSFSVNNLPLTSAKITLKCTRTGDSKVIFEEPAIVYLRADGIGGAG